MNTYNSPFDYHFSVPRGKVMKKGSSLDLEKGQLGIFDIETTGAPTAVTYFGAYPKDKKFVMRVGRGEVPVSYTGSNFNMASITFSLRDIIEVRGIVPDNGKLSVDDVIIGYNGIDEKTSLTFKKGETLNLYMRLTGPQIGMMGYENSTVDIPFTISAPDKTNSKCEDMCEDVCKTEECLPIILKAIEELKEFPLRLGKKVKDVIDISPVHHCRKQPDPKIVKIITYKQTFKGADVNDIYTLLVAKFPKYKFKKVTEKDGTESIILTVDETIKLEPSVELELKKTAKTKKELEAAGFSNIKEIKAGFGYSVIADVPADDKGVETVKNILKEVFKKKEEKTYVGKAEATELPFVVDHKGFDFNKKTFIVYSEDKLDLESIELDKDIRDRMTFKYLGEVAAHAKGTKKVTVTAEKIKESKAAPLSYVIDLPDNEKTGDRLQELQKFYPELKIEVTKQAGGCKTRYCTNILSEPVDKQCSFIYEDLYHTQAPREFRGIKWKPADSLLGTECLCGIRFRGKIIKIKPTECVEDQIPFIEDSVGIRLSAGFVMDSGFGSEEVHKDIAQEYRSRRTKRTNLAGHLREDLKWSKNHFINNFTYVKDDAVSKFLRGESRDFDPEAQIVDFAIKLRNRYESQTMAHREEEDITYHIIVEYGYHEDVKELLNNLATSAGLDAIS